MYDVNYSKNKKLIFKDISFEKFLELAPFGASENYHVEVECYGYLHDTGVEITLTPVRNGEEPRGWEEIEKKLDSMWNQVQWRWDIAISQGYHGV